MVGVGRCIGINSMEPAVGAHHQSSIISIHHGRYTRDGDGNVDTRYAAKNQTGKIRCQTFSSLWPSQVQSTDKVAEGAPHPISGISPDRGGDQSSALTRPLRKHEIR